MLLFLVKHQARITQGPIVSALMFVIFNINVDIFNISQYYSWYVLPVRILIASILRNMVITLARPNSSKSSGVVSHPQVSETN